MQGPSSFWVRPTLRSPPHPLTHPREGPDHSRGLRGGQTEVQPGLGPSCPRVPVVRRGLPTHCAPSQPPLPSPSSGSEHPPKTLTHQIPEGRRSLLGPARGAAQPDLTAQPQLLCPSVLSPSHPVPSQESQAGRHESRFPDSPWGEPGARGPITPPPRHPVEDHGLILGAPTPSPRGHGPAGRWLREGRAWVGLQAGPPARSAYR